MYEAGIKFNMMAEPDKLTCDMQIKQIYQALQELFHLQSAEEQHFLELQALDLANRILENPSRICFSLPTQITLNFEPIKPSSIPPNYRQHTVGGKLGWTLRNPIWFALRQRLFDLEQSTNQAVATGAALLRFATVRHMVRQMLPAGKRVIYSAADEDDIPSLPVDDPREGDVDRVAVAESPYLPEARRFFLPQWVAFGSRDQLLVRSIEEAEAYLASMRQYLQVLQICVELASYIVVDEVYQQKRYGMLGQFVNQGRAMGRYLTYQIIRTIKQRSEVGDLNRGLSLDLPYFDDLELRIKNLSFTVIPAGYILFVPAFVVRAAQEESWKVAQNTHLSPSTRRYLINELQVLARAFDNREKIRFLEEVY